MKEIPQGSPSYQKRNPHLFSINKLIDSVVKCTKCGAAMGQCHCWDKPPKRLRQSSRPLMNKLEIEWFTQLCLIAPNNRVIRAQAITFRLANGLRYTPDMFCIEWPTIGEFDGPTAWEVKGKWFTDDANAKLKMFATIYPEIRTILVWKGAGGVWQSQRILP